MSYEPGIHSFQIRRNRESDYSSHRSLHSIMEAAERYYPLENGNDSPEDYVTFAGPDFMHHSVYRTLILHGNSVPRKNPKANPLFVLDADLTSNGQPLTTPLWRSAEIGGFILTRFSTTRHMGLTVSLLPAVLFHYLPSPDGPKWRSPLILNPHGPVLHHGKEICSAHLAMTRDFPALKCGTLPDH